MARICLYGDLQRFGRRIDLRVKRGLKPSGRCPQLPAFRQKLNDGWYQVRIAGRDAGETELSARLNEPLANGAVIHIVPRLAGAKVAVCFRWCWGGADCGGMVEPCGLAGCRGCIGHVCGRGQYDPGWCGPDAGTEPGRPATSTDNGKQNTYFSSLDNMVAQGNVLPVLYGEMRVGLVWFLRRSARQMKGRWSGCGDWPLMQSISCETASGRFCRYGA